MQAYQKQNVFVMGDPPVIVWEEGLKSGANKVSEAPWSFDKLQGVFLCLLRFQFFQHIGRYPTIKRVNAALIKIDRHKIHGIFIQFHFAE